MKKRIVRFEIQDLLPIGLTLVVAGIGIVYGLSVMSDIRGDMCTDTGYYWNDTASKCQTSATSFAEAGNADVNASKQAILGVAKIPEKMPLIATVIVAAVIIGILVRYLMVRFA